jgi:hypothetical protein
MMYDIDCLMEQAEKLGNFIKIKSNINKIYLQKFEYKK